MFKVNNRNIRRRCKICSKLTIKTPYSSVSIVNFEQVKGGFGRVLRRFSEAYSKLIREGKTKKK